MLHYLEDHGLPLVQLKEQRRDLIVALTGQRGAVASHVIMEIAALQQTIAAIEAVLTDLDDENRTSNELSNCRTFTLVRESSVRV